MDFLRNTLAIALFISTCFFSWKTWQVETFRRSLKADAVELSHIKYGLFNVDEWKIVAAEIVEKKVNEFEITEENREEVVQRTEEILRQLIDEVEKVLREENKKSLGGMFRQLASDILVPFNDVRKGIPEYAEMIVDRLNDPETKGEIKDLLIEKIDEFADETVGEMDYSILNEILVRHQQENREDCLLYLEETSVKAKANSRAFVIGLAASVIALLILVFTGAKSQIERLCFSLSAFALLAGGVTLPMIDIEATITEFSFLLIGEPVSFQDQVLFFQSKSILEVVMIMIEQGEAPLMVVALLIFSFSILMPLLKLIFTMITQVRQHIPRSKFIRFFLFRSAKWSMADVMVVSLFMAFIGFSGVINSQLTQLERESGTLEVFTTNNSTLQLGFYLFTAYALIGLLLGYSFKRSELAQR
ncbi:MAG: paraquat-inducible protein A [Flavobacteriales bacterium]|nr:paraquat-inducible protein A [Flavobacteriales bacterium]